MPELASGTGLGQWHLRSGPGGVGGHGPGGVDRRRSHDGDRVEVDQRLDGQEHEWQEDGHPEDRPDQRRAGLATLSSWSGRCS
jgi:hypothetical protein